MTFDQFQLLSRKTRNPEVKDKLLEAAVGASAEAGEMLGLLKKARFQGHPVDRAKLVDEAGDILWYLAELADELDLPLEIFATRNVQKLEERFEGSFSAEKSMNRKP